MLLIEKACTGKILSFLPFLIVMFLFCTETKTKWQPADGPLFTRWAAEVLQDSVLSDYPRPQMERNDWMNLNGLWQLSIDSTGQSPQFGTDLPDRILVPFPVESALSGVMKRAEKLFYRRTFEIPEDWTGERFLLHFGAVDWETTVYVNGKNIGTHCGGYDPFYFDITDALKEKGEQELIVEVFDPTDKGDQPRGKQVSKPRGIWYTPCTGIWQTVWLEPLPEVYINDFIIEPDIDKEELHVKVFISDKTKQYDVEAVAFEGLRRLTAAEGKTGADIVLKIRNPRLWSPANPYLYNLKILLKDSNQNIDILRSYFGMRKISLGKDETGKTRIMLNNKFVFQVGPLDQGFWPDGIYTAPTDQALRYDIEITKLLGFNMTRKHVKIEPDRWYYWCDKLGLLVWQDMPSGNNKTPESRQQFEFELEQLIKTHRNHPSIIMWVVFNEGWGQYDTERLVKMVKEIDPTRLVNNASGWTDKNTGDIHDIHRYPGPASIPPEKTRAAVLGEFGGLGLKMEGHTWEESTWGYRGTENREHLTRKYQRLLQRLYEYKDDPGLSAGVYTQITDVETEANGLMTYDREIIKVDDEKAFAANNGDFSTLPEIKIVVPTSQQGGFSWKYTFERPGDNWFDPDFDDSGWKTGKGGFGKEGTPGAVIRTEWTTEEIWIRRDCEFPSGQFQNLQLYVHHDEDAEIYINGILAAKISGYTTEYEESPISPQALQSIKPGRNFIAVYCVNKRGGQYIDVGFVELVEREK